MEKPIYVFQCSKNKGLFGLTYDSNGLNLPKKLCLGSWVLVNTINTDKIDIPLMIEKTPSELMKEIDENGYYIHSLPPKL